MMGELLGRRRESADFLGGRSLEELKDIVERQEFYARKEDAYKVLEITPDVTDAEVRAAYRRLALKHHPDKVATLGEDIRRAAEEKLQEINDAKERIYKARGMR